MSKNKEREEIRKDIMLASRCELIALAKGHFKSADSCRQRKEAAYMALASLEYPKE